MPTTYAIPNGRTVMDATTFTENASTNTIVNAAGFKPDFVWVKSRTDAYSHNLSDSIRGVNNILRSNSTLAESTVANSLTAFNSNGFTLGSQSDANYTNGASGVGWQWQAGQGTTSSNTQGSITSTVSANTTAGFSIVTYTGTGSNATVGHGLGVAPAMIIIKNRAISQNWPVWHKSFPSNQLYLNLTNALDTPDISSVGASTFAVDTWDGVNGSGNGMVAYCWAEIAGYSAFGKYTGNGSTNGPFIYTGFRPRWIMIKRTDDTYSWWINDSARDPRNVVGQDLAANLSQAESSDAPVQDFLSNGFKLRTSAYPGFNANGGSYIYAAFAENPFKFANAR